MVVLVQRGIVPWPVPVAETPTGQGTSLERQMKPKKKGKKGSKGK